MKINWGVLGTRLGYGILTGLLTGAAGSEIPKTTGALLSVAAGAAIAAAPSALSAAGIIRPVSADQQSLFQMLGQSVSTLISDSKAQRQQDLTALAQQAGTVAAQAVLAKTGAFTAEQLGGGLNLSYNSAPAAAPDQSALAQGEASIAATGGNQ